ncbi:unnamed protein product, partial [Symbiodinium sp. CCMP2592]
MADAQFFMQQRQLQLQLRAAQSTNVFAEMVLVIKVLIKRSLRSRATDVLTKLASLWVLFQKLNSLRRSSASRSSWTCFSFSVLPFFALLLTASLPCSSSRQCLSGRSLTVLDVLTRLELVRQRLSSRCSWAFPQRRLLHRAMRMRRQPLRHWCDATAVAREFSHCSARLTAKKEHIILDCRPTLHGRIFPYYNVLCQFLESFDAERLGRKPAGVPEDKVDSRVRQAVDASLTARAMKEIFDRKAPDNEAFKQLNALATSKNFRFVHTDELSAFRGRRLVFSGRDSLSRPPLARKMADPWANGEDLWSNKGSAPPVVETFADGQDNDLRRSEPGPGFPWECERLLGRSSVTQRLRQLPVFMHQLGNQKVQLKREKVLQVNTVETVTLVVHRHTGRLAQEARPEILASLVKFLRSFVNPIYLSDVWCGKKALQAVLALSGSKGVSVFVRANNDDVTQGAEALYDVIPFDARKALESVASMAARLPASPVVTFTDTQASLLILKEHYVACVKAPTVHPFPTGGVRVLKGFSTVADCHQSGWTAFVESTWTYKERRDSHKRACRVSFSEPPDAPQVWTSQAVILIELVLPKTSLRSPAGVATDPSWQWTGSGSPSVCAVDDSTFKAWLEAKFEEFEVQSEARLHSSLSQLDEAVAVCIIGVAQRS